MRVTSENGTRLGELDAAGAGVLSAEASRLVALGFRAFLLIALQRMHTNSIEGEMTTP